MKLEFIEFVVLFLNAFLSTMMKAFLHCIGQLKKHIIDYIRKTWFCKFFDRFVKNWNLGMVSRHVVCVCVCVKLCENFSNKILQFWRAKQ